MDLIAACRLTHRTWLLLLCATLASEHATAADTLPPRSEWRALSSSAEGPGLDRSFGIDGDIKTRWGGGFAAGDWYQVDMGRAADVGGVLIRWDTGFARRYTIQTSLDGKQWRVAFETADSPGSIDYVFFPAAQARFVRIASVPRTADWGVSIFEFEPIAANQSPQLQGLAGQTPAAVWSQNRALPLSGTGASRQLLLELPRPLATSGLEVFWERAPQAARLEGRDATGTWTEIANDPESPGAVSFLAAREARDFHALRMTVQSAEKVAPSIRRLRIVSPSRTLTALKRYEIAAGRLNQELFPSSLRAKQVYWTAVGIPAGRQKSIFDEYGNVEAFKGAPLVQPVWRSASGKSSAAFDKPLKHSLREGWMPMPAVEWDVQPGLSLRSEAMTIEQRGAPVTLVRHRLRNTGAASIEGQLSLLVRPMQICPPWQNAGLAPIYEVSVEGEAQSSVRVNGRVLVHSLTPTLARGTAAFGPHGETEITRNAAAGTVPASQTARDEEGLAAAILSYAVSVAPGAYQDVVIALPLGNERIDVNAKRWPESPALDKAALAGTSAGVHFDMLAGQLAQQWQARAGQIGLSLPDQSLVNMLRAQASYMLINQTGHAIQPGPRNYNRSFIRDGAATAAILVRMGMAGAARDYLKWYAEHAVHPNGLVSPILNDDGTVNTGFGSDLEHDSQGQLIWLIAEIARLDGGPETVRAYLPTVKLALKFLQELRERTLAPGYLSDKESPERFRGIIAPSISHEGYSTPTHSYWDDYWALKGWHDGAWLAAELGDQETARWAQRQYGLLRESMAASIRATMKWKGADFIPAAADLGDGDPTSVSIALDPAGQIDILPADALKRTFDRYLADVRKRDLPNALYAYTPYEMRNVLTYVHLNRPREANELLMNLLRHRRPAPWQVLAEVVYSDLRHAIYLGDMPHTWIGSEYARAIFGMLMHETDKGLKLLPGAPPSWVAGEGLSVTDLPTAFGKLTMQAEQSGNSLRLTVGPGLRPDIPLEVSWPSRQRPKNVRVDGVARTDYSADGIKLGAFRTLEAQW
jgi:hypothetical protein